jgi:hypothetical protein
MMRLHFETSRQAPLAGAIVLALAQLAIVACDKMPLSAPTGSTVTVRAAETVLGTGGSTEVTAYVSEQAGTPVQNGTTVRFTTNLGRMEPAEVQTNAGYAVTRFMAGDVAGEAIIRANSGSTNVAGNDDAPNAVKIRVGAAAVESISLRATPSAVPFEGGTVQIVATVLGPGNRVLPGIPVHFNATQGTVSAASVLTDGNGQAQTSLTLGRKTTTSAESVTVTATAGAAKDATVTVLWQLAPPVPTVALQATCETAVKTGQSCSFTATVSPENNDDVRPVKFEFDFGDGTSVTTSSKTTTHVFTSSGVKVVRVHVSLFNGTSVDATIEVFVNLPLT